MTTLRTANLLGALAGHVDRLLMDQLRQHPNQTDSSAAALNALSFYEGCSNLRLSQALRLSHTATVRLVDKLEQEGLVESRSGQDKRSVALFLTEAGRARARKILTDRCQALDGVVSVLSAEEQKSLSALLDKMLRSQVKATGDDEYICRLCDSTVCPAESCPVHQATLATLSAEANKAK